MVPGNGNGIRQFPQPGQPTQTGAFGFGHVGHKVLNAPQLANGTVHASNKFVKGLDGKVPSVFVGGGHVSSGKGAQNEGSAVVGKLHQIASKLRRIPKPLLDVGQINRADVAVERPRGLPDGQERFFAVQVADARHHPTGQHEFANVLKKGGIGHPGHASTVAQNGLLDTEVQKFQTGVIL